MRITRATSRVMRSNTRHALIMQGISQDNRKAVQNIASKFRKIDGVWIRSAIILKAFINFMECDTILMKNTIEMVKPFEQFDAKTLARAHIYLQRSTNKTRTRNIDEFVLRYLVCNIIAIKYQKDGMIINENIADRWKIDTRRINYIEAEILAEMKYNADINYEEIHSIMENIANYQQWFEYQN